MGLIRVLARPREVARDIQNALACVIKGASDIGGPPSSPLGPFESNPPGNGGELSPEVQSRGRKNGAALFQNRITQQTRNAIRSNMQRRVPVLPVGRKSTPHDIVLDGRNAAF